MGEGLGPAGRGGYIGKNGTTVLMYGAVVSEWRVWVHTRRAYMASWTLPSLKPPMTRESKYVEKVVDFIHLHDRGTRRGQG
jgi:hypothetical protein